MKQVLLILLLLVACTTGQASNIAPTFFIGGLFALTGDGASWGQDELNAVQLAINEHNLFGKQRVELIAEDTQTKPSVSLTSAVKLIEIDNVPAIIGATWDESTAVVAPISERSKTVLIGPSSSGVIEINQNYSYYFSTTYNDADAVRTLLEHMKNQSNKDFVLVFNKNLWASFVADLIRKEAERTNIQVIEEFELSDYTTDFRTVLLKIKQKSPDALFFIFTTDATIQPFLKEAGELGLHVPMYSASMTEHYTLANWYSQYSGEIYHPFPKTTTKVENFKKNYERVFGQKPTSPSAVTAYDATRLVLGAIDSGARTGDEIRLWLEKADMQGTVVDRLQFDSKGFIFTNNAYSVRTIINNTFVDSE
ncbi:MAG: ABC transporter substrate-binding protein [Candidatus Woesearchaeota archaeon]|nr:ABC transporter substrate-binding protein [Candidatus Woesearchaeota archaeon]